MAITQQARTWLSEIAELISAAPSQEQLLKDRPSDQLQQRANELLTKLKSDRLTAEEQRELDEFQCLESLIGLIKARIHALDFSRPISERNSHEMTL